MSETGHSLSETLLGFVFPPVCQLCGDERADPSQGFVGTRCRNAIQFIQAPFCARCGLPFSGVTSHPFTCSNCHDQDFAFTQARAAVVAKGVVLEAIHRFKYQRARWFQPFLSDLLQLAAIPELTGRSGPWSAVVPVPLHPLKFREREFNQAEILGLDLAQTLGLPLESRWVERIIPTLSQTTLSREQRSENVRRAFRCRPDVRLSGRRLIVVDDVFTTGATASAVARQLRQAGAAEVIVWAVARGL